MYTILLQANSIVFESGGLDLISEILTNKTPSLSDHLQNPNPLGRVEYLELLFLIMSILFISLHFRLCFQKSSIFYVIEKYLLREKVDVCCEKKLGGGHYRAQYFQLRERST